MGGGGGGGGGEGSRPSYNNCMSQNYGGAGVYTYALAAILSNYIIDYNVTLFEATIAIRYMAVLIE